jgi:hypothetical protein
MELFAAHNQWATRPDDQRFATVQALYDATRAYAKSSAVKNVPFNVLRTEADKGEVKLVGKAGIPALRQGWGTSIVPQRITSNDGLPKLESWAG